jgi:SAM-dependent methyltransferase
MSWATAAERDVPVPPVQPPVRAAGVEVSAERQEVPARRRPGPSQVSPHHAVRNREVLVDHFEEQAALRDEWAATYDDDHLGPAEPAARALAQVASGGAALELGIGAGRVAIPLAELGLAVSGVDASTEMIRLLEERRGGLPVQARVADMACFTVAEPVPLIYVVSSTFFLLGTAERQKACLDSCARALTADGRLVVEAAVPGTIGLPLESGVVLHSVTTDVVRLSITTHDDVAQTLTARVVHVGPEGPPRLWQTTRRYVRGAELDVMAHSVGLRLEARYADWSLEPYIPGQPRHVSVYARSPRLHGRTPRSDQHSRTGTRTRKA